MRPNRISLFLAVVAAALLASCGESGEQPFPVRTYNMGEKVSLGHLNYQVYETQWLTHIGEGSGSRIPQNRFFLVRLTAVNGLGVDAIIPTFTLQDDNGNTYPALSGGEGVPQYIGYLRSVKPAESVTGNALFDAPPRHYKIKIADESGEKTAYVDLPLSFVSETPDVSPLVPEKKKK